MARGKRTARYSAERLGKLPSKTDFARLDAMTEEALERSIAGDPDWAGIPPDWYKSAKLVMPKRKALITLRLDPDIVAWFRRRGAGYQTRINAALRAFVSAHRGGR